MPPAPPAKLLPVVLFNAAYMLAAIIGALIQGNREFIFYIVVMLILIGVMGTVHHRVRLTTPLLWAFSVWGLAHMAGGLSPCPPAGLTMAIRRCSTVGGSCRNG